MKSISTTINIFIGVFIGILLIGILFKIMHWPGSGTMFITSKIAIGILCAVRFWLDDNRSFIDHLKAVLIVLWASTGVIELFIEHRSDQLPYMAIGLGALIAWALTLGFEFLFRSKEEQAYHTIADHLSTGFM